jgi:hypothetical protein
MKGPRMDADVSSVSYYPMDGMVLSTGNIYLTTHDVLGAHVFRTGQTSIPGQEIELYSEHSGSQFGDIVWAKVGDVYYGYFWTLEGGGSFIKRIPLTGTETATVLSPPINDIDIINSYHNLATDGVSLFWQSAASVSQMPIGGGPVTQLDPVSPNTPTAGVYLNQGNLIYADVQQLRYVPVNGATTPPTLRIIATDSDMVTTILPLSDGIYWGNRAGAIRVKTGPAISDIQPGPGPMPSSIGTNSATTGGPLIWTQDDVMVYDLPRGQGSFAVADSAHGASMNSGGIAFWGDANGVHRFWVPPRIGNDR